MTICTGFARMVRTLAVLGLGVFWFGAGIVSAQTGGGGGGPIGGGTGLGTGSTQLPPGFSAGNGNTVNNGNTGNTGNGGGNSDGLSDAEPLTQAPELGLPEYEFADIDNQPFVGTTASNLQEFGFVGANSQSLGGADSSIFGGGVNNGGGSGGSGGARTAGGNRNTSGLGALGGMGGFGGLGGAGSNMVQDIPRGGVRTRLVNSIAAPRLNSVAVAERFQQRLGQLPAIRAAGPSGISIAVENGTATLTGTATSAEQAQKIIRQLRLEPGIYRVENRVQFPGN